MTDYNDGNWHGWNGGECPVHPETTVEVRYEDGSYDGIVIAKGCEYGWAKLANKRGICAFRVIKEHREPREVWVVWNHSYDTEAKALDFAQQMEASAPGNGYGDTKPVRFREVMP